MTALPFTSCVLSPFKFLHVLFWLSSFFLSQLQNAEVWLQSCLCLLVFVSDSMIVPKRNCIRFHDILNQEKKTQRLWQNVQVFRKSLQVPWPLSWQVLLWSQLETVISLALQCTHPMPRAMGIFTPLLRESEKCSPSRLVRCSTRGRCLAEERQAALPPVDAALARTRAWQVRRRVDSSPHLPIDQGTGKRRNGAITHGHECLCLSL